MTKLHSSWLVPFFYEKNILVFNGKNGLRVKQLAKQAPTLKTLMQKILDGLLVKNFKLIKAKFLHKFFGTT